MILGLVKLILWDVTHQGPRLLASIHVHFLHDENEMRSLRPVSRVWVSTWMLLQSTCLVPVCGTYIAYVLRSTCTVSSFSVTPSESSVREFLKIWGMS